MLLLCCLCLITNPLGKLMHVSLCSLLQPTTDAVCSWSPPASHMLPSATPYSTSSPPPPPQVLPPCQDAHCPYTEGLRVGWKALLDQPVAFPFGHGLSYTTFTYEWAATPAALAPSAGKLDDVVLSLRLIVRNVGAASGSEVAQLYLAYPTAAGEPALVLRGFRKTALLLPGDSEHLTFGVTAEGLSIWNPQLEGGGASGGGWERVAGEFTAVIGSSSRNHTLRHAFVSRR